MGHLTRGTNEMGGNCGEGVEGRGVVDKEGGRWCYYKRLGLAPLINYLTLMRSFFNLITILTPTANHFKIDNSHHHYNDYNY